MFESSSHRLERPSLEVVPRLFVQEDDDALLDEPDPAEPSCRVSGRGSGGAASFLLNPEAQYGCGWLSKGSHRDRGEGNQTGEGSSETKPAGGVV